MILRSCIIRSMNRINFFLRCFVPFVVLALALKAVSSSIPVLSVEILMGFDILFALALLLSKIFCKDKLLKNFPTLINCFCTFTFVVAVAVAKISLSEGHIEGKIPIVAIVGEWICKDDNISGFIVALSLIVFILFSFKPFILDINEDAEKAWRGQYDKIFEIDQKLRKNLIYESEAKAQKDGIKSDVNRYCNIAKAAKIFMLTINIFAFLLIINVAGGTAVGVLDFGMTWQESFNHFAMIFTGYSVMFAVPLIIVSVAFSVNNK